MLTIVRSLVQIVALVATGFIAWQNFAAARSYTVPSPDLIGPGLDLYRSLQSDLPESGLVGFLPSSTDDTLNAANYFVAQYALAPRVVLNPFDDRVPFVVTGVDAPPTLDRDPRLTAFELAAVRGRGVRVYRRKPQ